MSENHDDVLGQMRAAGLLVDHLDVGRMRRCKVEGDREKRGWYVVHQIVLDDGRAMLVGSFGIWQGDSNNATKIELGRDDLSREQRDALRKRLADDRKRAERDRKREADKAAARAAAAWGKCTPTGDSAYLTRKGVQALGVRFSPSGALVIPVTDGGGKIHGLQIIRSAKPGAKALDKEFWPSGMIMRGHYHQIGMPSGLMLIAEGYATAATLHMATGLPVAAAWSANNLGHVADALVKRYRGLRVLICADDDDLQKCRACKSRVVISQHPETCPTCGEPHQARNAGVSSASVAAMGCGGAWVAPVFADPDARGTAFVDHGRKATDFNDLHLAQGLDSVRVQIEAKLEELGWRAASGARAGGVSQGGGGRAANPLRPIDDIDELIQRFSLVYGQGGMVFDAQEHQLVANSDVRDLCLVRELHRDWMQHPDRRVVRVTQVGFDPTERDPDISCNLWAGWPTEPAAGTCHKLLDLLRHMCSAETANHRALYRWMLCWLAYPIQHHGAKLKTAVVIHGPQGTGKNLLFEAVMAIYGRYGRVIDQSAIEDKFNDWASRKLFLIADEVVARSDLYHVKNKLKAFITGDWIRINPKNMAAYDERNHVNLVFLSNESMPVVLEEDDRRHAVIWTPGKLDADFYREVRDEINNGGIAALHHYLLHFDTGDFEPGTPPPKTAAKDELISLSLDTTSRFYGELAAGDIGGIAPRPCLSQDLYDVYRRWCARQGNSRAAPLPKLLNALDRKHGVRSARKRYLNATAAVQGPHSVVLLGDAQPPPGVVEQTWLGEQIGAFSRSARDYLGADHGY